MTATGKKSKPRTGVSAAKAPPPKFLRRDVTGCSACGTDHTRVLFQLREDWERKEYPYVAKCPLSGKPVLLKLGKS